MDILSGQVANRVDQTKKCHSSCSGRDLDCLSVCLPVCPSVCRHVQRLNKTHSYSFSVSVSGGGVKWCLVAPTLATPFFQAHLHGNVRGCWPRTQARYRPVTGPSPGLLSFSISFFYRRPAKKYAKLKFMRN